MTIVDHLGVDKDKIINEFIKGLSSEALLEWQLIKHEANPPLTADQAGFNRGIQSLINIYAPDPNAKETMREATSANKNGFHFHNDLETDLMTFTRRMTTILCYVDQL